MLRRIPHKRYKMPRTAGLIAITHTIGKVALFSLVALESKCGDNFILHCLSSRSLHYNGCYLFLFVYS